MSFIPHTETEISEMLAAIGAPSIDALFDEIPAALRIKSLAAIPDALSEMDVGRLMQARASQDVVWMMAHARLTRSQGGTTA